MADDLQGLRPADAARVSRVTRHFEGGGDFTQPPGATPRETPPAIRVILKDGEVLLPPETPADAWVSVLGEDGEWIQTSTPVPGKVHAIGEDLCIWLEGRGYIAIVPGLRNIRCILLDDLENNGTVQAAVLTRVQTNDVQAVKIIGSVNGGTFTITYKASSTADAETTDDIAFAATGADVQAALEALSIEEGDIKVDGFPGLWFVQFLGQARGVPEKLTVDSTNLTGGETAAAVVDESWEDSGRRVTVTSMVPVGSPTPMVGGAVALCMWFGLDGYGACAVEPRDFRNTV